MELLVALDDYCVQKVRLIAAVADVSLEIRSGLSSEDLVKLEPTAKSMLLRTSSGFLSQHNAILCYLSDIKPSTKLLGLIDVDRAQVDSWLEFSWQEIEVPLQVIIALSKSDTKDSAEFISKATADLLSKIIILEDRMRTRTYLAGETVSLADLALYVVFHTLTELEIFQPSQFPGIFRWYMTVRHCPAVSEALSQVLLSASKEILGASTGGKWNRGRIRVKELLALAEQAVGQEVVVKGWIRTSRSADKGLITFVELTDGSTVKGIQLVINSAKTEGAHSVDECGGVGASLEAVGTVTASTGKGQVIEVAVTRAVVLGPVFGGENGEIGTKKYPMAKKQHSLEFLREIAHLRPRSKVFSSAMRMRHAMAFATHKFFNERGFVYTHTPLITAADCEGAGEQFAVSTLLPENAKVADIPVDKNGLVDFSKDFFSRRCCLTVSGQLNVETHACALSDVYTFGPTFRAEDSHTSRHLAEFWMIEPEICFAELADDMALAEDYIQYCAAYALEHCADDLHYFENEFPAGEKGLVARLRNVVENDFARITYTEAVALLQQHIKEKKAKFKIYPNWGDDLGSEHERYITEKIYQKPTIVINYPKGIKAFYMKLNDDNETVAAMDILVPRIGELVGGSQREDKLEVLERRCIESGMKPSDIWWYADLRKYGTVPHAGFGLGFERLIMFVTGLENIRDVISFPRVPGHAEF